MLRTHKKKPKRAGDVKPVIVHTKRQQVVDDEGWTHVVDKPQRGPTTAREKLHTGDFERNGVSYVNKTAEELRRDYEFWVKQWKATDACEELKQTLMEKRDKMMVVKNVVVLGLGSMQSARREGRRSSATQLVALQTVIEVLGGSEVIMQDPQYTELDGQVLEGMGYRIMEDPEAFRRIDENTLVFAIHCYKEVYGAVATGKKPAVFIGTDISNFKKFDGSTDGISESLDNLVDGCESLDFPQITGRHDFSDTKIYWRMARGTAEATKPLEEAVATLKVQDGKDSEPNGPVQLMGDAEPTVAAIEESGAQSSEQPSLENPLEVAEVTQTSIPSDGR